jgi:hypothetical protein
MAAFLVRALELTDTLDDPFTDDDDSIFEADIERLAAAGITKGCNPPTNDRYRTLAILPRSSRWAPPTMAADPDTIRPTGWHARCRS